MDIIQEKKVCVNCSMGIILVDTDVLKIRAKTKHEVQPMFTWHTLFYNKGAT